MPPKPPVIVTESKRRHIEKTYNISLEQYNSLRLAQKFRCAICNIPEINFQEPLLVDHDHKTGEVRGLLCRKCNFAIGLLNDSPKRLIKAAAYIKGKNNVQTLLDYVTVLITAVENNGSKSRGLYPRK